VKSLAAMIEQLDALTESDVTPWEYSFICSIVQRYRNSNQTTSFSAKQVAVIEKIYKQHFGDSE
jgi:hypothetical protein